MELGTTTFCAVGTFKEGFEPDDTALSEQGGLSLVDRKESAGLVSCFFAGLSACLIVVSTGPVVEVGALEPSPIWVELLGTASFFACLAA